ncbi:unnamed protein product [Cylindrotheca closterium]|uniref:NAD(P)-binding domain-containing protein n=1 Tax=Cylindrotheca closterium TaxID=2856 RepID=A0AAD2JMU3_9STRA|nr:unnamed protein product [Cylindrotheca closterium]
MIAKKAVVAGATGSVGRLIVQTCIEDPRIEKVTAVVRRTVSSEKAEELWGSSDSSKLSQLVVDYPSLTVDDAKLKEGFQGCDAFLTGLGVYSGNTNRAKMESAEIKHNSILAKVAHEAGAKRGSYLSGQGVLQPKREGKSRIMFAQIKGQAEETLAGIFIGDDEAHVSVRPGGIFDRPGPPVYGFFDAMLAKWPLKKLKETKYGISANDIAKGMVQGALFDDSETVKGNTVWENNTIKEAARRYETYFKNNGN